MDHSSFEILELSFSNEEYWSILESHCSQFRTYQPISNWKSVVRDRFCHPISVQNNTNIDRDYYFVFLNSNSNLTYVQVNNENNIMIITKVISYT
ncbi:MAG: hypothetical protein Sylvanvirus10_32 [Sylvanvirus sp.]|uniref:Uncharacterized protein n=1 Tax=Sylvanvirus sp. TaxID=2487774 RepID=A0A3G5AHZ4_9VIRU|nr:MAG: hypothetical protein Sylvanvirus10_32 [Sylvanvirus sp.]